MMAAESWVQAVPEIHNAVDSNRSLATSESIPASKLQEKTKDECRDGEPEETSAVTPEHQYNNESGEEGKEDAVHDLNDDPPKSFPQKVRA